MEFIVKCLQFTVHQWDNEKAARLTFLQSQVVYRHFFIVKNNICFYAI